MKWIGEDGKKRRYLHNQSLKPPSATFIYVPLSKSNSPNIPLILPLFFLHLFLFNSKTPPPPITKKKNLTPHFQNLPLRPLPTLTFLLAFAFMRSLVATCYAFTDFDAANALALAWDGEFDTRPSFFTPETYAANQGWGDGTSPQVANRAAAARGCCAALTALAGVGLLAALAVWRKERMVLGQRGERVGSVGGGGEGEEGGGAAGFKAGEEVEGREVVEMGEGRRVVELAGSDGRHEAEGKQMHEMEGGAGAHEVQGAQIHEMAGGEEQQRRVYEMDASEDAVKWERHP